MNCSTSRINCWESLSHDQARQPRPRIRPRDAVEEQVIWTEESYDDFQDLQAAHEALLKRQETPVDPAQFWIDVQRFIDRVRNDAEYISAPRERDQLRAILRFWASYVFDQTGSYPDTTLRPAPHEDNPPPPPPPPPHRTPIVVWAIAVLAVVATLVAVFALWKAGETSKPPGETSGPTPDLATQVYVQMQVNAAMTAVVAARSTPTDIPTSTPTITPTPLPTQTPVPSPTPTPTPIVVRPATRLPPTPLPTQPPAQVVPLDVGYQILTQGPSPFDPTVWVMQLRLVGYGGNGVYIFWVNGRPDQR